MTLNLIIFLTILVLAFLVYIYRMIKKSKINFKYALLWITVTFVMFIAILIPDFLKIIANFIGIETVSNMIFLLGIGFLLIICFALTAIVSKQKTMINILVQEVGVIKNEINK